MMNIVVYVSTRVRVSVNTTVGTKVVKGKG